MMNSFWSWTLTLSLFLVGCVGPAPIRDYNLANTAIKAAKKSGAANYAPAALTSATNHFQQAEEKYKIKEYEEAKKLFKAARMYAEKAENQTRVKKFKTGETFP